MVFKNNAPTVLGTGLVCLDIIRKGLDTTYFNGGSCGNVISALSFLGLDASVVKSRYSDCVEDVLNQNFKALKVQTIEFGSGSSSAPRIIQDIVIKSGETLHKFFIQCPECGRELPKVKLLDEKGAEEVLTILKHFNAFYTDRTSDGIRLIRDELKLKGTWTIYEPNSAKNINSLLDNSLQFHIVKFSSQRIPFSVADKIRSMSSENVPLLIVVTLGKNGLCFSYRNENNQMTDWEHLNALPTEKIEDTSGAGDWCTAGLIFELVNKYRNVLPYIEHNDVVSTLRFGQTLSAISCSVIGAQGLFYTKEAQKINPKFDSIKPALLTKKLHGDVCSLCLLERKVNSDRLCKIS